MPRFIYSCSTLAVSVLGLLLISSCAPSQYLFENMQSEYQTSELPAVFASGEKGWVGTAYLLGNSQPAFATYFTVAANETSMWPDEKQAPARYLVKNVDWAMGTRYTLKTGLKLGLEIASSTMFGPVGNVRESAKLGFTLEESWR